jgi:DNA-binding phage protein
MGCENGIIKIYLPSRNQVVNEFDMEQALRKEEGIDQSLNQIMDQKIGQKIGDILDIV